MRKTLAVNAGNGLATVFYGRHFVETVPMTATEVRMREEAWVRQHSAEWERRRAPLVAGMNAILYHETMRQALGE